MAIVDIEMPKLGESIVEATILKWLKNPGDKISLDEPLLEIATDKVDSEVPSTTDGVVTEILYNVDDVVPIGSVIARIDTAGDATASSTQPAETAAPSPEPVPAPTPSPSPAPSPASTSAATVSTDRFYSPLVLKIASKEGISMAELETLPGTGKNGRVTKKDILAHVANKGGATPTATPVITPPAASASAAAGAVASADSAASAEYTPKANEEVVPMDRMRKLIAKHMVDSWTTSPHVTSFSEADVTNLVNWRNRIKDAYQEKYGEKITFTPLFMEAVIKCIKDYPMINSSIAGDNIIVKHDINIGMATALPSGNLIVPVIKNADHKNLVGLTSDVNALATKARNNKLSPADTQDGTFTITNVGTFGSLMGTPIINQPQVAILALGTIVKRPMVMETEAGDVIAIRHMMYLSLSYDHRIVDGSLGASFLTAVAKQLEAFDPDREI